MKNIISTFLIFICVLTAGFSSWTADAYGWMDIQRVRFGHVLARGLAWEGDNLRYVEYDQQGRIVPGWSFLTEQPAYVLSGEYVQATLDVLDAHKTEYNNKVRILSVEEYNSQEFKTVGGLALPKITLPDYYKSVAIKPTESILHPTDGHILLLARFDLTSVSAGNFTAGLFDMAGEILHTSQYNIAFKSGFYEGEDPEKTIPPILETLKGKKAYAPFHGAKVEVYAAQGYPDYADENGEYNLLFGLVPCPGFFFEYTTPAWMTYEYTAFTPNGVKPLMDVSKIPGYDACIGYDAYMGQTDLVGLMAHVEVIGIMASIATPAMKGNNFYVDTGIITGAAALTNGDVNVPLGSTKYIYKAPDLDPVANPRYDFDGDLKFDLAVLGNIENDLFVCKTDTTNAEYQGIYLSSEHSEGVAINCDDAEPEATQPDLYRLADKMPDFTHQGLLESISEDDLQDTDILIFREATGMLITERRGITQNELNESRSFYGTEDNKFIYQMMIRGPAATAQNYHADYLGEEGFNRFQSDANMNPALYNRDADHLKQGETLNVILINRKTGYIGANRTLYYNGYANGNVLNGLSLSPMQAPNLKISAERYYKVTEGPSASNEQQTHLIGFEGSAMASDQMVTITTEWYNHDGTPLPDGLDDFGYTGRLAKIDGSGLVSASGLMEHFAIKPGKHIVQIKLPDDASATDHFYIQVSGEPKHGNPSFSDGGASDSGPLQYRPKHYVPFMVPVLDQLATLEQTYLYNKLEQEGNAEGIEKPDPIYRWVYRPELQFSTYDLAVNSILREQQDGQTSEIYQKEVPMIAAGDSLVKFMYDLIESNQDALEFLGEGQELVFALGANEIKAKMGPGNQLIFTNLEHIASLDVEDFVTLSLYNNNDPTNVLWEYAFEAVAVDTRWAGYDNIGEDGTIYVSADDPVVPVQGIILGYANRENPSPLRLKWKANGAATVEEEDLSYQQQGVFPADIRMSTQAGARAEPYAYLDADNVVKLGDIEVVPGVPANISITKNEGDVFIEGHKGKEIEVYIEDAHGNAVADGTSVSFAINGAAKLTVADDGTIGGKAKAFIVGGSMPEAENTLLVSAGDASAQTIFSVQPLVVTIADYPTQMEPRSSYPVTVRVTEPGGAAVSSMKVVMHANAGKFKRGSRYTNGDGELTLTLYSGFHPLQNIEISARVGLVKGDLAVTSIEPKADSYADTSGTMLIGDETVDGYYEYERYDGATLGLAYQAQANIVIHGAANETQTLKLGSLAEPNIQPVAAYIMNDDHEDNAVDFNQLHHGVNNHITLVDDNPTGTGKSYQFSKQAALNPANVWESSRITVPQSDRFKPATSVGFRLDIKPTENGGQVFDFEGGVQTLTLEDDGRLTYSLFTKEGKQSVSSAAVALENWHTVAGRYKDGQLALEVNGELTSTPATGELAYSVTQRGLTIGEDYSGNLSSVKFYDYDAEPLMTFEDGSAEKAYTFAADENTAEIKVISSGQLNKNGELARTIRVGMQSQGQDYFVGVISKEFYGQFAAYYTEAEQPAGYPPVAFNYYKQYTPFPLIGVAHAGFFDWSFDDVWDNIKTVANVLLPFEDIKTFYEQVNYLIDDDKRFDPMELTISGIGVLTIVPILKPLIPLKLALKGFFRSLKVANPKFIKVIGRVLGRIGDDVIQGKYDTAFNLGLFMILVADMIGDDEARAGLMAIVKSIQSDDDFFAWLDYLSLPADGWDGDEEPPEVGLTAQVDYQQDNYFSPLNGVMGVAYANKKKGTPKKKVDGKEFAKDVNDITKQFKNELQKDPQILSKLAKAFGSRKGELPTAAFRRILFNKTALKSGVGVITYSGARYLRHLISNKIRSQRVSGLTLTAVIAYLESRMSPVCSDIPGCQSLDYNEIPDRIRSLYSTALSGFSTGENPYFDRWGNGSTFELMMIAVKQVDFELGKGGKIRWVNKTENIRLHTLNNSKTVLRDMGTMRRDPDIIVESCDASEPPVWVELKSFASPYLPVAFRPWYYDKHKDNIKGSSNFMKEFFLDRVASTHNLLPGFRKYGNGNVKLATKAEWWMQVFKTKQNKKNTGKLEQSYTKADNAKLFDAMSVPPEGNVMLGSLGYTSVSENQKFVKRLKKGRVIMPFNIKNWILSPQVKDMLLSEFKDVLVDFYDGQTASDFEWDPQC